MESAFTGLRKYRVPLKANKSITLFHLTTPVAVLSVMPRVYFSVSSVSLFVSPTLSVPTAQLVLVPANATGIKE